MSEVAVKAYSREANRLFQRGVAAARGGQRRVAAGLLTRAVQLDPRHEAAWLWLSGVLDDPHDVAFCLNAALRVNPHNERARNALRWLEERRLQAPPSSATSVIRSISLEPAQPPEEELPWYIQFRQSQRVQATLRVMRMLAVALFCALFFFTALLYRNALLRPPSAPAVEVQASAAPVLPLSPPQQPLAVAPEVARSLILAYLSEVQQLRQQLLDAEVAYRQAAESGRTAVSQATAAHAYREQLRQVATRLQQLSPPEGLQDAHAEYLQGLEFEQAALDDLLQFYSEYNVALANRAALRLQEANSYLSQARAAWEAYRSQIAAQSPPPPFDVR